MPPHTSLQDGLSEDEAVAAALWNNARFHEALSELGVARADLVQAGMLSNPNFSILFPVGSKQMEFAAKLPVEALWLRPRRVAVAKLYEQRVLEGLVQNGLDLVRNVRVAFADAALAMEGSRLARESLELHKQITELAEARLRAGDVSELETSTARVAAARAREEANSATHALELAQQALATLLGSPTSSFEIQTGKSPVVPAPEPRSLIRDALASRPDLRAAEINMEAAAKKSGLSTAEMFTLSAVLDANEKDSGGFEIGPGAEFAIPVLNQNQGARARSRAEVQRAAWQYAALRQQIGFEVNGSWTRHRQAREALENWRRDVLPPLEDAVEQTKRAYEAGEVSLLNVHQAARERLTARTREAELIAALRRAQAELERSVGHRLDGPRQ